MNLTIESHPSLALEIVQFADGKVAEEGERSPAVDHDLTRRRFERALRLVQVIERDGYIHVMCGVLHDVVE